MKIVSVNELKGNEIAAQDILTSDYQMILPAGFQIKVKYIDKLRSLGIAKVYIKDESSQQEEISILKEDVEVSMKEKVKEVLEKHTYRHNEELASLNETADHVITEIAKEDEVMEKVYDVKQRSTDIFEHSLSVCSLAILTAIKLGYSRESLHDIGVGCLLHDIGLQYLTISYQNEDVATMSRAEIAEFKRHPVYAYSALRNEKWLSDTAKAMILYHHERLDGSGYPLHATQISEPVQILTVCDTFDEMICGISCKKVKVYEAIEYLKTFKNVKYSGKIVDAFFQFTAVYPVGTQVLTGDGETGIVVRQNREFPDRPVLRIIKDKNGRDVTEEKILDLILVQNVFIEKAID